MTIRVLELTAGLAVGDSLGGAARFVIELTRAFDRNLIEPFLGCIWKYGVSSEEYWQAVADASAIPYCFGARWRSEHPLQSCIDSLRGLWKLPNFTPDIIHSHGEFTDIAAILLKRKLGARYLVRTRHSIVEWPKRPALGRIFGHWIYPGIFDLEIAVSRSATDALNRRKLAHFRRQKAIYIPNAIDFYRFELPEIDSTSVKKRFDLPENAIVIGSVGSLSKLKGYDMLLKAFQCVVARIPSARLVFVGDGPERSTLQTLAESMRIEPYVRFLGSQQNIEHVYRAFDLFVSSSYIEGLPTVLLESIASGVPVVATNIPGSREIIEDGVTGLLTPPGNPEAMAEVLIQALQSPQRMKLLATEALRRAKMQFSMDAVAKEYTALFQRLTTHSLEVFSASDQVGA
ncbi:glycosyltransferase family 4 protein [Caldilinea sp.]|uniref:glycosyltransferase family 4 protein n=1 Tax=Caldilinea sp. TaxID=2293560 RepID=UPI0021DC8635|nr:glycosyltransferase family 4 protein [Caldilinea sp.]GIV67483.1 MAG: glycosyl transferase family 1 [Caldilinea sp.]